MQREEMIRKIYEAISDKTLSFGCRIMSGKYLYIFIEIDKTSSGLSTRYRCLNENNADVSFGGKIEIIGHPVMIGDVLEYAKSKGRVMVVSNNGKILFNKSGTIDAEGSYVESMRIGLTTTIDEQPTKTIEFVYSLLEPNQTVGHSKSETK